MKAIRDRISAGALQGGVGALLVDAHHKLLAVSLFFLAIGNFVGAVSEILEEWERSSRR